MLWIPVSSFVGLMWCSTCKQYSIFSTPLSNKWSSCCRLSDRLWLVLLNKRWMSLCVTMVLRPLKYHYLQGRKVNLSNIVWIHREGSHKWTWACFITDVLFCVTTLLYAVPPNTETPLMTCFFLQIWCAAWGLIAMFPFFITLKIRYLNPVREPSNKRFMQKRLESLPSPWAWHTLDRCYSI